MTVDEILYRQEGIIAGLEIAISSFELPGFQGDKESVLSTLQTLLETEQAAYRTMKAVNQYDPTSRSSWRTSQRFFRRSIRHEKQEKPALAHDDQCASSLAWSLAEFVRPRRSKR